MNRFLSSLNTASPKIQVDLDDRVQRRILCEYGAVLVAKHGATPPDRIIFRNAEEVGQFQSTLDKREVTLGGFTIVLQAAAMDALMLAISSAQNVGLEITPRGPDSAARNYEQTVTLWLSRVHPALEHWTNEVKISSDEADGIRELSPFEQVSEVLELEENGIYFSKDLSKSIMYSVAPPGTSQHLSMLALDIEQFNDPRVRKIMAENGWYQTVISDLPHFTYLGLNASELTDHGLVKVMNGDREFWVPDLST